MSLTTDTERVRYYKARAEFEEQLPYVEQGDLLMVIAALEGRFNAVKTYCEARDGIKPAHARS